MGKDIVWVEFDPKPEKQLVRDFQSEKRRYRDIEYDEEGYGGTIAQLDEVLFSPRLFNDIDSIIRHIESAMPPDRTNAYAFPFYRKSPNKVDSNRMADALINFQMGILDVPNIEMFLDDNMEEWAIYDLNTGMPDNVHGLNIPAPFGEHGDRQYLMVVGNEKIVNQVQRDINKLAIESRKLMRHPIFNPDFKGEYGWFIGGWVRI